MLRDTTPAFIRQYNQRVASYQGVSPLKNPASGYSLHNDYAAGSRTYNGTSPSPHAGPGSVDPAGYQERDAMQAAKKNMLIKMLGVK